MMLSRSAFESGGPVAVATAVPNPAVAGQTITLRGASSFHQDPAKSIVGWKWDLDGDGAFDDGTGVTATVSFAVVGDYAVGLRVEDGAGAFAGTTLTVSVAIPPLAPTAEAGGPYAFEIGPGRSMTLDGTGSANPDDGLSEDFMPPDGIVSYEWDLDGDGVVAEAVPGPVGGIADAFRGALHFT